MKRDIKCLLILLALSLCLLSLAGCDGQKETINLGDGGKVVVGENEVSVKDGEGNEVKFTGKWPDSELGKKIPAFTKGKIASAMDMGEGLFISITEVKKDDFSAYYDEIKEYIPDGEEVETEEILNYSGSAEDGTEVFIQYYKVDEVLTITGGKL